MQGSRCDATERPACAHACPLAVRSRPALSTGSGLCLRALRRRARRKVARQADGFCVRAADSEHIPAYPVRFVLLFVPCWQHTRRLLASPSLKSRAYATCFKCWLQNACVVQEVEYDAEVNAQYWSLRPVAVLARSLGIGKPLVACSSSCVLQAGLSREAAAAACASLRLRTAAECRHCCRACPLLKATGTFCSLALKISRNRSRPARPVAAQAWRFPAGSWSASSVVTWSDCRRGRRAPPSSLFGCPRRVQAAGRGQGGAPVCAGRLRFSSKLSRHCVHAGAGGAAAGDPDEPGPSIREDRAGDVPDRAHALPHASPTLSRASSSMQIAGPCTRSIFHAARASRALSTIRNERRKQEIS